MASMEAFLLRGDGNLGDGKPHSGFIESSLFNNGNLSDFVLWSLLEDTRLFMMIIVIRNMRF